ncbi:MAG: helix-hairpin-helix domain-containing protein [Chloroflexota bacterium]
MLDGVIVPVQQAIFSILYLFAVIFWGMNQALLLVGYYILTITSWLSQSMFQPLLTSIGNSTDSLLLPVFTLAMLALAISYLLGVFGVIRVVEFRSAVTWMFVAVLWFQFGPSIYLGFEQMRRELGGAFFAQTFTDLTSGSGTIEGLGQVGDAGDLNINPPTNNFGAFLTFDTAIDGLDIALAYLDADGCDVLRTPGCLVFLLPDGSPGELPTRWYTADAYFDLTQHGYLYPGMTNEQRQASLEDAGAGIWRAFSGIVVSLFGMLEQIVQLLLTIAFGIGFATFFIAMLFAFFKRTEVITQSVFDILIGLFLQSIITSLLLALVMAFVSVAGATGNGILLLGVGFIGIILVAVLLLGAVSAILQALNGLMKSFGTVTGGNIDGAGSVAKVAGAAAAVSTGGATLLAGGTAAQALGAVAGPKAGQQAYYASRAFGNDSLLGQMANQVAEGSAASYAGPIGGYALGSQTGAQRDAERTRQMTLGTPITVDRPDGSYGTVVGDTSLRNLAADGQELRYDPVVDRNYAFQRQDNGDGLRTYEDGSTLRTDGDDAPNDVSRRRAENRLRSVYRADDTDDFDTPPALPSSGGATLSQASIDGIDASDDDENAAIVASVGGLAAAVSALDSSSGSDSLNDNAGDDNQVNVAVDSSSSGDDTTSNSDTSSDTTDNQGRLDSNAESFLAEMERDYPGSTGFPDLVDKYFPDESESAVTPTTVAVPIVTPQVPNSTVTATASPEPYKEDNVLRGNSDDSVRAIDSVGPTTQDKLASMGINTAGQLANANPDDVARLDRVSPARAEQLVNAAQQYISPPPTANESSSNIGGENTSGSTTDTSGQASQTDRTAFAPITITPSTPPVTATSEPPTVVVQGNGATNPVDSSPSAAQYAAAVDASNNDDGVRLATSIGSAINTAMSSGRVPSTNQAQQIATQSGLPPGRESSQFVQVASAMNLTPQQAQNVVSDVQNTGQIGTEVANAVRSSLASLTLPNTGQSLDDGGMDRAVSNLERAAQALVQAANSMDSSGGASGDSERATSGGGNSRSAPATNE